MKTCFCADGGTYAVSTGNNGESQEFYHSIPSFAEYGGNYYGSWEVLTQDLPTGTYTDYVEPIFVIKYWDS